MSKIIGLKFRYHGQIYYFLSDPFVVSKGDYVLAKTDEGIGLGQVALCLEELPEDLAEMEVKPIFRLATQEDIVQAEGNKELSREALLYCREMVKQLGLEMRLVDVEVFFDKTKMVFYFTAPERIDFRELVRELVKAYRTRIELRQIGVRHETQMLGGIGNCGQVCCCRRFLRKFDPVTIKMAKDQNLFLNPAKISGVCGRLLCCLAYEKDNYTEFQSRLPKIGRKFQTPIGKVKTLRGNLFRESITVLTEENKEMEIAVEDWQPFLNGEKELVAQSPETSRKKDDPATDFSYLGSEKMESETPQEEAPRPRRKKSRSKKSKGRRKPTDQGEGAKSQDRENRDHGKAKRKPRRSRPKKQGPPKKQGQSK